MPSYEDTDTRHRTPRVVRPKKNGTRGEDLATTRDKEAGGPAGGRSAGGAGEGGEAQSRRFGVVCGVVLSQVGRTLRVYR